MLVVKSEGMSDAPLIVSWKAPMIEEREYQHDCSLREAMPI
jgi:hypothetical protein